MFIRQHSYATMSSPVRLLHGRPMSLITSINWSSVSVLFQVTPGHLHLLLSTGVYLCTLWKIRNMNFAIAALWNPTVTLLKPPWQHLHCWLLSVIMSRQFEYSAGLCDLLLENWVINYTCEWQYFLHIWISTSFHSGLVGLNTMDRQMGGPFPNLLPIARAR